MKRSIGYQPKRLVKSQTLLAKDAPFDDEDEYVFPGKDGHEHLLEWL